MLTEAGRATMRASRTILQSSLRPTRLAGRRHLTTAPPHATSRSWKNSALRWGLAGAGIYYYNTSPIFAEYPQSNLLNPNVDALDNHPDDSTIDQLTASSRNKAQKNAGTLQKTIEVASEDVALQQQQKPNPNENSNKSVGYAGADTAPETDGAAELEDQAGQEGAFNPVTGEINWDCPCLGGMAYGPCGEQFKAAFSCFVYSNEEPKGMECIDKFQNMQDCFRAHPEVYRDEIEDNDALDGELAQEKEELQKEIADRRAAIKAQESSKAGSNNLLDTAGADPAGIPTSSSKKSASKKQGKASASSKADDTTPQGSAKTTSHTPAEYSQEKESAHGSGSRTISDRKPPSVSADAVPESDTLVPKAAHDATGASDDTQSRAS